MEKCYPSHHHTGEGPFTAATIALGALAVIAAGIFILFTKEEGIPFGERLAYALLLISVGLVLGYWGYQSILDLYKAYGLNALGIFVQYTKKRVDFFPWDSISNICLTTTTTGKLNYADGDGVDLIWITTGKVPIGPPNRPWYRDLAEYAFIHRKTILTIELTPERLAAIEKYYKEEIIDYRKFQFT